MAEDKTTCPNDTVILEDWECEIAGFKFQANRNPFKTNMWSDVVPGGCYCEIDDGCGNRGLNRNLNPRATIQKGAGLCRMEGHLSQYIIIFLNLDLI